MLIYVLAIDVAFSRESVSGKRRWTNQTPIAVFSKLEDAMKSWRPQYRESPDVEEFDDPSAQPHYEWKAPPVDTAMDIAAAPTWFFDGVDEDCAWITCHHVLDDSIQDWSGYEDIVMKNRRRLLDGQDPDVCLS